MSAPVGHREADLLVIGFGKGGKTPAATQALQGRRVLMVEQSAAMYGGTCINIGCVPTKSMVYHAEEAADRLPSRSIYTQAVLATRNLTADLRAANFAMLNSLPSVDVLTGTASFIDEHTVAVQTADTVVSVSAQIIVVNTGSEPVWPDVPGLHDNRHAVTSTELLSIEDLPERMVVLGGGYVGLEFAAMYAAYGTQVTVLEHHDAMLAGEDSEISSAALTLIARAGVSLISSVTVTAVDGRNVHYRHAGGESTVAGDCILVASGRKPATVGLGLENAGVITRSDGSIVVDERLRTSQPHIFAIGDVNGGPQFTYVSLDDYRVVHDQLSGSGRRTTLTRQAVPYVLFMTPPLARVGMTRTGRPTIRADDQGRFPTGIPDGDGAPGPHRRTVRRVDEGGRRRRLRSDPGGSTAELRRPRNNQCRLTRDAARDLRHRLARLDLHTPVDDRGIQPASRDAELATLTRRVGTATHAATRLPTKEEWAQRRAARYLQ